MTSFLPVALLAALLASAAGRGCFAPWVQVRMADGSLRAIADVEPGELVLSWNPATTHTVNATVLRTDFVDVAGRQLHQISFNSSLDVRRLDGQGGLIFTEDHPLWSARLSGLVSSAPELSLRNYGLATEPMDRFELFMDEYGHRRPGVVDRWTGTLDHVVTLQLEGHHWFYAEGVRAHNKGFGGHHGSFHHTSMHGTVRRAGGYRSSHYAHFSYHSGRRWTRGRGTWGLAVLVAASDRRRRGTWNEVYGNPCRMDEDYVDAAAVEMAKRGAIRRLRAEGQTDEDAGPHMETDSTVNDTRGNTTAIEKLCAGTMNSTLAGNCSKCQECQHPSCFALLPGCQEFLSNLYYECDSGPDDQGQSMSPFWYLGVGTVVVILIYSFLIPSAPPPMTPRTQAAVEAAMTPGGATAVAARQAAAPKPSTAAE